MIVQTARDKVFGLAIESSNPSAEDFANRAGEPERASGVPGGGGMGVALAEMAADGATWAIAGEVLVEPLRRGGGREDDLMPAIDRVCRRAGVDAGRIGLVAVSVGPGGFTALRVSVTVANVISYAKGSLCVAVPSASVVARRIVHSERFAVLLASKGPTAFATVFSPGWDRTGLSPIGKIVGAPDIGELDVDLIVADRHLAAPIRREAESRGIRIEPPTFDPAACLELATLLPGAPAGTLLPLYPREPEAVTLWNARQGR